MAGGKDAAGDKELSAAELDEFRGLLLSRREEIETLAAENRAAGATVELDQQSVGRLSRMDAMERQAMALETRRRREMELRRIEAALTRLDEGDFGYCTVCDEPIARKRLSLDPTVVRCVDCA